MKAADRTAAIVLAAGCSSRMGTPKALLPVGEETVIRRVIRTLRQAGCDPVVVVTGHKGEALADHLRGQPVAVAHNPDYQSGMFSSVLAGVAALVPYRPRQFFVLPVDHLFVSSPLLEALLQSQRESGTAVTYPMFGGAKGHPPLISHDCIPSILLYRGEEGLRGALAPFDDEAGYLEWDEPGILTDMDTPEAYRRSLQRLEGSFEPRQLFLQGDLHIGKSTLLADALRPHLGRVGGFYVQQAISRGRCVGFCLRSVAEDGLREKKVCPRDQLFLVQKRDGWHFSPQVFEDWAAGLLHRELEHPPDMMLLDEIGGMELGCPSFSEVLYQLLESGIPCAGVYKQQKNARAQQSAIDTGPRYDQNRQQLVKTLAGGSGGFLTLKDENREEVRRQVEAFVARHLDDAAKEHLP